MFKSWQKDNARVSSSRQQSGTHSKTSGEGGQGSLWGQGRAGHEGSRWTGQMDSDTIEKVTSTCTPHPALPKKHFLLFGHLIEVLGHLSTTRFVLNVELGFLFGRTSWKTPTQCSPSATTCLPRGTPAVTQTTPRSTSSWDNRLRLGVLFLPYNSHAIKSSFIINTTSHQTGQRTPSYGNK